MYLPLHLVHKIRTEKGREKIKFKGIQSILLRLNEFLFGLFFERKTEGEVSIIDREIYLQAGENGLEMVSVPIGTELQIALSITTVEDK